MMPDWIDPDAFLFKLLWQTSACLGLGLVLTSFIRHPARRHGILLLCILAAIVTPVMTIAFSSLGWGLWPAVSMNGENSMPPADL
ncbi:MAG: hypothetical protein O7G85_15260 [Planctomycetota bacterium]|nr:hypothetical protein [Planctomycetota bacterium]